MTPRFWWFAALVTAAQLLAGGCSTAVLFPPSFPDWVDEAPEDQPIRFMVEGRRLVGVAVPGSHVLPAELRRAVNSLVPGGETVFIGREWGPSGEGYRVEKQYPIDRGGRRSVLISADAEVLEQSYEMPSTETPRAVLFGAMGTGRTRVERVEVVQRGAELEFFRVITRNDLGWLYENVVDLSGRLQAVRRIKSAELRGR